jgi:hypothetical protein
LGDSAGAVGVIVAWTRSAIVRSAGAQFCGAL